MGRDGIRFLLAISDALLLYRPGRFFLGIGSAALVPAVASGLPPVLFYLRQGRLEEWMIYRLLLAGLLITCASIFVSAGMLADQIVSLVHPPVPRNRVSRLVAGAFSRRRLCILAGAAAGGAVVVAWPGLAQYGRTGEVTVHWSRPLAGVFLGQLAVLAGTHVLLQKFVGLWQAQVLHDRPESPPLGGTAP